MFLFGMFFMIHFLLVISLYHPISDFLKEVTLEQGWFITGFDENEKRVVRTSDGDVSKAGSQEPSVAVTQHFSKHIFDDKKKRKNEKKLYLRRVACLGKKGEIAKTVCCTDDHPKPWAILLPTKYKVKCYKPNCRHICYSEIIKSRGEKQPVKNYDFDETDKKKYFNPEKNRGKIYSKKVSFTSPTVAIPEVILELIDLCNFLNNSKLLQFDKLNSFCKMKNMNLNDFLNHVHYNEESNSAHDLDIQQDSKINEPILHEEMFPELTESSLIKSVVDHYYNSENMYEGINKTKSLENMAISDKHKTYVAKPHALYSPNVSTFKNNKVINSELSTTRRGTDLGLDTFEDNLVPFDRSQSVNLIPLVTENVNTCHYCDYYYSYDETTETSSIINKAAQVKAVHDPCCCNCPFKDHRRVNFNKKKKLAKLINLFFHGPRPTFASKTKCPTLGTSGSDVTLHDSNTPPMSDSSSILFFSVLKTVKPEIKSSVRSYSPKESIKHYVDYIDDKCACMYKTYKQAQWEYETNITHDTRQKSMSLSLEFNKLLRGVRKELARLSRMSLNDINLQRQIKLLSLPGMDSLPEIKSNELEQIIYAMETIYSSATVGKYNLQVEKIALNQDIRNIMADSTDPNEQKYYWIEWRKAIGKHVRSLFEHYVSLMRLAANQNGFHDASEMWTRQYESDDFIDMLSVYWEGVKPLYLQLHAYVRNMLHGLYGDVAGAKDEGKIPAHLTGDIWSKNWINLFSKVKPYNISDYLDQPLRKKLTPQKIAREVENIFLSLGFKNLPNEFWDNSIFTKDENKLILCEPSAWDMGNGKDFRIKMCATGKVEDLFKIHNLVTLTEYYKEYKELPFAFRNPANPGFSEAIGETMVLSAQTKEHLKLFGIYTKRSEKSEINKLMRIALEKVAFIPYSFIVILWRNKVFTGEINATNYNSEWWKLRSEYQGIYPPVKRNEDDFDVGCKQHIIANQPYIKYFLSTILQFQFYEALCRQSGFQGTLHNCNIAHSAKAGKTLRNAMSMGASHHWKDVMEVLTGTRKIDSRPMMRYFEPLMKWLQQKNKERNVRIGWEE